MADHGSRWTWSDGDVTSQRWRWALASSLHYVSLYFGSEDDFEIIIKSLIGCFGVQACERKFDKV